MKLFVILFVYIFLFSFVSSLESVELSEVDSYLTKIKSDISIAEHNCIPVPETKNLLISAEAAYKIQDYSSALDSLKEAELYYLLETKGEFNAICYIKNKLIDNLMYLVILIIFIAGIIYLAVKKR
jgi:hypothetical protein